jgi:hypothetical protein
MTMLQRLMPVSAVAVAFLLLGCEDLPTADTLGDAQDELLLKKGGGGKPGAPADPVLAFHLNGAMWVMNDDGSNRTQLVQNDCSHSESSWAPTGDGTAADPYRIINSGTFASCGPGIVADVDTEGGSVHVTNVQPLDIAGSYWDTQVWGDPVYGSPAWQPGAGTEIALTASWLADPTTNEWVDALYVILTSEIPNPTPQLLYQPPTGCGVGETAWSPDGTAIAFFESCDPGGSGIKVLERATGILTTLLPFGVLSAFAGLDWSRSGGQLAFGADGMVYTLRLGTEAPQLIASGLGASWSPDTSDTRLAFNTWNKRKVRIIDFATGSVTTLGNGELPDWRR